MTEPLAKPPLPAFEPEGIYDITVSRVVPKVAGVTFRPGQTYQVKGKVADSIGDAIATAAPASADPAA